MSASLPNDGGAAFPRVTKQEPNGDFAWGSTGMSLRDWFAGQALAGMLANHKLDTLPAYFAKDAYKQADAMLAERSKEVTR